ncbi:group 1 glycosyl transferase [Calothrix sp. NIES-2100]|uniref:glycosyltransferase family 4 protein n=1 Tax=Calothrix sp. NIES-2100 TaxID=1954172 RepID=UPI000B5EB5D1|nr:group 1 glycosyl transferase [Calothrix sp. NIES-2100]
MKIAIVAWGYILKPPLSNSIYTLMYEYTKFLTQLGHEVDFIDEQDVDQAIEHLNNNHYDFVHLYTYDFVGAFNQKLKHKYCFTCQYGYLLKEDRWDEDFQQAFKPYMDVPGIIAASHETKDFFINKGYSGFIRVQPNGIDTNKINFQEKGNNQAVCLGWIQPRKQQRLLAEIIDGKLSLDFVGPLDDPDFTEGSTTKYLGIWSLQQVYANLTNYNCLVLISDGEVAPLVVLEALAAGLCVVISESASANLHPKQFIKVLPDNILSNATPENKIIVTEAIMEMIEKNQYYRQEIVEYAKENFDFSRLIPNYLQIIDEFNNF